MRLDLLRSIDDSLAGIRILDLSTMLAGPYAAMLLAGMGAEVWKVEGLEGDPARTAFGPPFQHGDSTYFQAVNLDKRSMAVDMRTSEGVELIAKAVDACDVVITNQRAKAAERLGLGPEFFRERNPSGVLCIIRGFGETGPWSDRPGLDLVFQGMSGLMSLTGSPDGPPVRAAAQVVDIAGGAFAATGIAGALVGRSSTGRGTTVAINLLDVAFALQNTLFSYFFATWPALPQRIGSGSYVSITNCFSSSDGYINVSIPNDGAWRRLCVGLDREDLLGNPRYQTSAQRIEARQELEAELDATFRHLSTDEWLDRLERADVPCGPVLQYDEAVAHPQVAANGTLLELKHPAGDPVRAVAPPIQVGSGQAAAEHIAPPTLSQHADEILDELKYSSGDRKRLYDSGIVLRPAHSAHAQRGLPR